MLFDNDGVFIMGALNISDKEKANLLREIADNIEDGSDNVCIVKGTQNKKELYKVLTDKYYSVRT